MSRFPLLLCSFANAAASVNKYLSNSSYHPYQVNDSSFGRRFHALKPEVLAFVSTHHQLLAKSHLNSRVFNTSTSFCLWNRPWQTLYMSSFEWKIQSTTNKSEHITSLTTPWYDRVQRAEPHRSSTLYISERNWKGNWNVVLHQLSSDEPWLRDQGLLILHKNL